LKETGFVEGQNVTIEYRWAEGDRDRMPPLAADLLQGQLKVVTVAGPHLNEHKQIFVQKGIPTVGTFSTDPSGTAAIQNLARTGVNITGATTFAVELEAKRCALLAELLPRAKHFGVFCRREDPNTDLQIKGIETVARSTGRQFELVNVSTEADIERAMLLFVIGRLRGSSSRRRLSSISTECSWPPCQRATLCRPFTRRVSSWRQVA
jgi:putative ABC transport system substrate-binding protein